MLRTRIPLPLCLACLALAPQAQAQAQAFEVPEVTWPEIVEHADTIAGFVPPGWRIEHESRGLLDADALDDALLVLRMDDPGNVIDGARPGGDALDTNPRMLVVALATGDGGWRRVMSDHALVPRTVSPHLEDFLADSEASLGIRPNRTWSVSLHSFASAGTWTTSEVGYTFRLEDDCMRLVGFDSFDLHRASGEIMTTSVNYLTGRAWTQAGHVSKDESGPKRWTRVATNARICIEDVGHGLSFQPALLEIGE